MEYIELSEDNNTYYDIIIIKENYNNYRKKDIKRVYSVNEIYTIANDSALNKTTMFEVLSNEYIKIFLDLENIPIDKPDIYKNIITDFMNYAKLNKDSVPYAVTINTGSSHPGLSYHVIFSVVSMKNNIKNLVKRFKNFKPEYKEYIDDTIYTKNRLFRLPEQIGLNNNNRENDKDYNRENNIHHIYKCFNVNKPNDFNKNYDLVIIQDIDNDKNIRYRYIWKPLELKEDENNIIKQKQQWSGNFGPYALLQLGIYEKTYNLIKKLYKMIEENKNKTD